MSINDQQVNFNVFDAMKCPDDVKYCNFVNIMDFFVAERLTSC